MVKKAVSGCDVVFHTAARTGISGSRQLFFHTNVKGTEVLLEESCQAGVKGLIYTGSPSAVFTIVPLRVSRKRGVSILSDSCRIMKRPRSQPNRLTAYGKSKESELLTVSLRPHLIYGSGDTNLLPRLVRKARDKRFIRVGEGDNLVDLTFIENAVAGHLCAMEELLSRPELSGSC